MRAHIYPPEKKAQFALQINHLIILISFFSCLLHSSCAQSVSSENILFAGSTPCDALIKQMAGIPQEKNCEFMKWEMRMTDHEAEGRNLSIQVTYGMTKANTNGFEGSGDKLSWTGRLEKFTTAGSGRKKLFVIRTADNRSLFYLRQVGANLFHFTDSSGKPLTGNGGWGYVLNRISENTASK